MKKIYKYTVKLEGSQYIEIPTDPQILTVQMQGKEIVMWALVDTDNATGLMNIKVYGTGHPVYPGDTKGNYIGTVQDGSLVWHVFGQYGFN